MWDLWRALCVVGFNATAAVVMSVGCYGAFCLAWRATADPGSAPPNRVNEGLRDQLALTESQLARERERTDTANAHLAAKEQEVLQLAGLLDELRRTAILFPPRKQELPPADLIPATSVPTQPSPVIPAAKE